jgi:hypothetical protein
VEIFVFMALVLGGGRGGDGGRSGNISPSIFCHLFHNSKDFIESPYFSRDPGFGIRGNCSRTWSKRFISQIDKVGDSRVL